MNSSRSYVVNGLITWIVDNSCTPHIVIDSTCNDVVVPQEHVVDGKITLNVSGQATRNFSLTPDGLSFDTRFGGQPFHVQCPVGAIVGVFAKENRQGMAFEVDLEDKVALTNAEDTSSSITSDELPSYLKVVKE